MQNVGDVSPSQEKLDNLRNHYQNGRLGEAEKSLRLRGSKWRWGSRHPRVPDVFGHGTHETHRTYF